MSFITWVGSRLLLLILVVALSLSLMYWATGVIPGLPEEKEMNCLARLAIVTLLAVLGMAVGHDGLPSFYESEEEEIVQELIIHEHPVIFRFTLVGGVLLFWVAGFWMRLEWPFHLGMVLGGTLVWLYFVDIVVAIFVYGMDAWEEIANSSSGSIIGIQAIGLFILLGTGVFYGMRPGEIPLVPPLVQEREDRPPKSKWESLYEEMVQKVKSLEKGLSSPPEEEKPSGSLKRFPEIQEKVYEMLKESDLEDVKKMLEQLRERKKDPREKACIEELLKYIEKK